MRFDISDAAREFENAAPQEILLWAITTYRPRIVLACSFGGPSGMVALDMVMQIDSTTPVYYLDTGLLFAQTYALVERVAKRYDITPIAVQPALSLPKQTRIYGDALWSREPDTCCALRKVAPQREFLKAYDAWISGIRRDQAATRQATPIVEADRQFGIAKINPLARWDERMVWTYIRAHELDYNELHEADFPSIGCIPCTRPIRPGESLRAGRWSGRDKTECGLHLAATADESP